MNSFALLHSNRFEGLRDLLVKWLRKDPLGPLENEVVLVQNKGMGQWLKMSLAEPDALGVAAAIETPLPAQFLWQAYRTVLADKALPETSPFDRAALAWCLMGLLPNLLDDERFAPLARYLDHDDEPRRRFQLARQLASLYDQYQVFRADWLEDWSRGGAVAADEYPWQPELWRRIVASVPEAQRGMSRAFIHQEFVERIATGGVAPTGSAPTGSAPTGLPRRVMVFGVTSLPRQFIEGLGALSKFCQVFMLVNDPSPEYWAGKEAHPLLAGWGRQGADYLDLLTEFEEPDLRLELFSDPRDENDTTLTRVQSSIFRLDPTPVGECDDTIAFHVAHGPQRELEVLHDELLARFEADPTLQPRDIVVMVPDIDTYAPHVAAAFTRIPYGIADRRMRTVNPILKALEWVLGMPSSRFGVNEVLDLLDVGALRRRFELHEDELEDLRRLTTGANVRWGLDAAQRGTLELPAGFEQNSWRFGLRRMLLGYANGDAGSWHDIEPFAEVDGQSADSVGKLVELLDVLARHWASLRTPKSPAAWSEALRTLLRDLFEHRSEDELKTVIRLHEALDRLEDDCVLAGFGDEVPIDVVADAWLEAVEERRRLGRFLQGQVTFCTLMPMRSIPFRMVCMVGMNDGDFPRVSEPQDFDLLARREHYRPGDRSRREDDRYQFLEAVLAARERLHVSWVGRSIRDNAERPPSVLVAQLRHFLGDPPVTEHPLQPFSDAYFDGSGRFVTYADGWNPPAPRAGSGIRALAPMTLESPLTARDLGVFLRQPVKFFLARRFDVRFPDRERVAEEFEPFELGHLDEHAIRDALLAGRTTVARLIRSGALASGFVGGERARALEAEVATVRDNLATLHASYGAPLAPVTVEYAHAGMVVHDDLSGVLGPDADGVHGLIHATANPLQDGHHRRHHNLTQLWVRQLLLSAQGLPVRAVALGPDGRIVFAPQDQASAQATLDNLLVTVERGLREPLPVECKSALRAFDEDGELLVEQARDAYDGVGNQGGQSAWAPEVARFYPSFSDLEEHGFVEVATTLYGQMVAACR